MIVYAAATILNNRFFTQISIYFSVTLKILSHVKLTKKEVGCSTNPRQMYILIYQFSSQKVNKSQYSFIEGKHQIRASNCLILPNGMVIAAKSIKKQCYVVFIILIKFIKKIRTFANISS